MSVSGSVNPKALGLLRPHFSVLNLYSKQPCLYFTQHAWCQTH